MREPALLVHDLCVTLGGRPLLEDVAFAASTGMITAVLGPNGAGKSTLVRAAAGLLPCTGKVLVAGVPVARLSFRERARRLAYVPQHAQLEAAIETRAVVALGRYAHQRGVFTLGRSDEAAIAEAMAAADVTHLADRRFTELSYGERRRVLIARALATSAEVLLLDEPTASLDLAHALSLASLLRRLASAGRCIVTVLHDLGEALRMTDRAVLLAGGRMAAQGSTQELIGSSLARRVFAVEIIPGGGMGYRLGTGGSP
jgi:iron complex transport system ATP-binding protein